MVNIKKAVITAAGRTQQALPLQTLVDCDGVQKSALRIILEEALSAGVDEICLVVVPGSQDAYKRAAGEMNAKLHFVEQAEPRGYGDALLKAREFVGADFFLHLVSDHLYLSGQSKRCAQQLVEVAAQEQCSVSVVQSTREGMLPFYGAVGGKRAPNQPHLYQIEKVLEKPTPTVAEQQLIVPGLRAGHYLCFFGMHALSPSIMEILTELHAQLRAGSTLHFSFALSILASREKYLACEVMGRRYNLGEKFGLLTTQLALGLAGADREEVLAQLVELLASRQSLTSCPAN
ncbi:MAG: sugar phosphate nucleotidyltransferase [Verrucomicrobiales bacterium]